MVEDEGGSERSLSRHRLRRTRSVRWIPGLQNARRRCTGGPDCRHAPADRRNGTLPGDHAGSRAGDDALDDPFLSRGRMGAVAGAAMSYNVGTDVEPRRLFLPRAASAVGEVRIHELRGFRRLAGSRRNARPRRTAQRILRYLSVGRRLRPCRHHACHGLQLAFSWVTARALIFSLGGRWRRAASGAES